MTLFLLVFAAVSLALNFVAVHLIRQWAQLHQGTLGKWRHTVDDYGNAVIKVDRLATGLIHITRESTDPGVQAMALDALTGAFSIEIVATEVP